jgi:hypothetical protein
MDLGRSNGPSAHNEMQNKGDDRKHQQQVNQPVCDVKHGKSAKPCDQQDYE